jgi:hypothetical protein
VVAAVPVLLVAVALAQAPPPPEEARSRPTFVVGEAIVKFRGGKASDEARLSALSREVGLPLERKRSGSAGEVVVSVDFAKVAERLLEQLRKDSRLAEVTRVEGSSTRPTEAIDFRCRAGGAREGDREIVGALARSAGLPLTGAVGPDQDLRLTLDLRALTLELIERLRKRPEVESAQPNYLVRKQKAMG